jgi:hypothetical protein
MWQKNKQQIIIGGIVLIVIVIVGIWFYRKGKRQVTILPPPLDNPGTGSSGGSNNNPYGVSNSTITQIADELYIDMDGFNFFGHNIAPYQNLSALSDSDFVNVYNTFNKKFQPDSGETLKKWMESESYAFDDVTDAIMQRMGRLNLK